VVLADTRAIAYMARVKPATVRSWAHRGLLRRHGTDPHGRALYDAEEAEAIIDNRRHRLQHSEALRDLAP
jgi:DNA-binding transcriptional MerR regulator